MLNDLLLERYTVGMETYGVPLMANTHVDPIMEAIEEMIDACVYLRAAIEQRSNFSSQAEILTLVQNDFEAMGTDAPSAYATSVDSRVVQAYRRQLIATKELVEFYEQQQHHQDHLRG